MNPRFWALVFAAVGVAAMGCAKAVKSPPQDLAMMTQTSGQISGLAGRPSAFAMAGQANADSVTRRFIAENHKLEITTPESELQKSWESVVEFCGTIRCEVVSSTITTSGQWR